MTEDAIESSMLLLSRQESLRLVLSTGLVELVVIIILSQNVKHPFMAGAFVTVYV